MRGPRAGLGALVSAIAIGSAPLLACAVAFAHDFRPIYVEIIEDGPGLFVMNARMPPGFASHGLPALELVGPSCEPLSESDPRVSAFRKWGQSLYSCNGGLDSTALVIRYPGFNPGLNALVSITWLSGEQRMLTIGSDETHIALPDTETFGGIAAAYLALGINHILVGVDHLLFVACLLWLANTLRRTALAITGFTLAHSVTLGLSAFDVVRVPIAPMEALIALSVVMLAAELVRRRRDTLAWRFPILVSLLFGLLHGFGFASVLNEIGLPETQIVGALVFFNLGIEIGQLAFAATMVLYLGLARAVWSGTRLRLFPIGSAGITAGVRIAGYAIGGIAAYWFLQRLTVLGIGSPW